MFRLLPSHVARALECSRWTESDARVVLDAATHLGFSAAEFAGRHRIDERRLLMWERRLAPATSTRPPLTFVEVAAPVEVTANAGARYEIQLTTGEILRIEGPVDAERVETLLTVLRRVRTC